MRGNRSLSKRAWALGSSTSLVLVFALVALIAAHESLPSHDPDGASRTIAWKESAQSTWDSIRPEYPISLPEATSEVTDTASFAYLPLIMCYRPATYYVSKAGNNQDGKSWATAWNELNQIDWGVIQPGDILLLDGGSTEMVYTTTLVIGKSGTPNRPITIALASETGRNGRAVIFGGRSVPLPYCGQTDYTDPTAGIRREGILLHEVSWVVIDGRKWRGILIHGHSRAGIQLDSSSLAEQIVFRGLEIYDNGEGWESGGSWQPVGFGVGLAGRHITFERTLIHDNGTDAVASSGVFEALTLRRVWLYNQRPHPIIADEPWNYCTHSDGVQVYVGGNLYGLNVEDSIIGPGLMHGLLLGEHSSSTLVATVHNVTIANSLFVLHHGGSSNANIATKYDPNAAYPNDPPTGYVIDNCTFIRAPAQEWFNILIHGTGHMVRDSVFRGGVIIRVDGSPVVSNNFWWQVAQPGGIGTAADPKFVDDEYTGVGDGFADFDFRTQNPVILGAGSQIASPGDLLGD